MPEMLNFKKQFGQNFIQSSEVIDDIIQALGVDEETFVLEIGPGAGALTIPLSDKVGHLAAIEIDPRLVKMLRQTFSGNEKVKIVFDDVLDTDFKEILEHENADNYKHLKIVGNIPYNITSPILTKVLECGIGFENFTVMIQKEVAERICADPGSRKRGLMSVLVQYYTEPTYIRTVGRELFLPTPGVDSAVVNLVFRDKPPVDCDKDLLFDVVKQSFAHKRKTLANNLIGYIGADKPAVSSKLESIGIDPKRRAETLSIEEFAKVASLRTGGAKAAAQSIQEEMVNEELSRW